MTAGPDHVAQAAEAVALGMAAAENYMTAAERTPGLGFQVALPSVPGPFGPPRGEGYNLPDSTPALRPVAHVAAPITYASPLVGGQSFGAVKGLLDALEGVASRSPTYRFVSASSPRKPLLDRIRTALDALLGRRVDS